MVGGGGAKVLKVSKVSHILGIINTIACFDTYEGSVKSVKSGKCVQMVSFRRFFAGIWAVGWAAESCRSAAQLPRKTPKVLQKNEGPITPQICGEKWDFLGGNANMDKKH